jgi:putative membrane protein
MYYYPEGGIYFGVPLSNFVGWFVVGATTIRIFQLWERARGRATSHRARQVPYSGLLEPLVYIGILAFNLFLTFGSAKRCSERWGS